jgi:hypothetical protein
MIAVERGVASNGKESFAMKKRLIALLVLAILVMTAPAAMATHCQRCRPITQSCGVAVNIPGWETCAWDVFENNCVLGEQCEGHGVLALSLASEYTVASVERLDEPGDKPAETLVASNPAPQPATR